MQHFAYATCLYVVKHEIGPWFVQQAYYDQPTCCTSGLSLHMLTCLPMWLLETDMFHSDLMHTLTAHNLLVSGILSFYHKTCRTRKLQKQKKTHITLCRAPIL
jgi:hypothetical protein